VDWLTWLADRSREHEVFRHDLDRFGSARAQTNQECALYARVAELMLTYTTGQYLAAREQERPSPRHVTTYEVFGPHTDLVCITDFQPRIQANNDAIDVLAGGKRITFATEAEPVLRLFLSGNPANIEQVSQATKLNAASVAKTLVNEGICADLTPELSAGLADLVFDTRTSASLTD
jgi:hypothetical protein